MPATGHSRRSLLLGLVPLGLTADNDADRTAITEMFGAVAAALSEENPAAAVKWFDPSMPRLERLKTDLNALVDRFEVSSEISILALENRIVVLDWFLELKSRGLPTPVERRRQNIKCSVGKQEKGWRILSLEPVEFFE
jgi:hypothetical protein